MTSRLIRNVLASNLAVIDRAEGSFIWDTEGRRYLDGSSGAVVTTLGHGDPAVLAAMAAQASRVTFTHRGAFTSEPAEELADLLTGQTGMAGMWLVGSGSEAMEAGLYFALQHWQDAGQPQRTAFLSHSVGYHGTTQGALSVSGHARRRIAEALLHPFTGLVPPYAYRFAAGRSEAEFTEHLLVTARAAIEAAGDRLAGVVVEAVGGAAAGAVVPPPNYLPGLAELCREFGTLLIVDEVMTGVGRTGAFLAVDHWGVRPDIVVLGKGLGAGYTPIAGTLLNARVLNAIAAGSGMIRHGHTYAGNPLSAAVALTVVRETLRRDLVTAARARGDQLGAGLSALAAKHPVIGEVRGLGLLHAVELVDGPEPQGVRSARLVATAARHGLLVYPATGGVNDAVLVAPPLTVSPAEVDLLLDLLDKAITDS